MVIILGNHDVLFFGPHDNPHCLRFWAERGLIHCEDSRDNSYRTMSVREFLQRIKAINDMLGGSVAALHGEGFAHSDELSRQMNFVEDAIQLAKKAKAQLSEMQ